MRSTQEGKPSFEKVEAAPESLPGKKTEAQSSESSCTKASFTVSTLLENFPKRQTWEKKGTAACAEMAWVSEAQALEARAGEAQAWEAQACKIQGRFNQLRQTSSLEVETARILKQEPVPEKVPEKEKSEDFFIRPLWSNKVEYIMAQVGYSVRTLHIWRFIYMWLHHGGWCFLIMYSILHFLVGVPLLLLEMAAGQRMRQGNIGAWKIISPWIGGVGYTSFMVCFISGLYFNVLNAWTITYVGESFQIPVSWGHCHLLMNSSDFGEEDMKEEAKGKTIEVEGNLEKEKGVRRKEEEEEESRRKKKWEGKEERDVGERVNKRGKLTLSTKRVQSQISPDPECVKTTPSMYFWYRMALKVSDSIEDGGSLIVSLILPFLVSWCLVGVFMINGLKCIGKVLCVLVPVPYFIMLCFLIRSLLLDGAFLGLRHMATAKISIMYSMTVWCQTGVQVLFGLGLGYGVIVSLSSHIHLSNNCLSDAFIVALINLGSMVICTTFIFCILGFWATVITHRCSEKNVETLSRLVILGELPPEAQPPSNLLDNPTSIFTSWLNSLPPSIKSIVVNHVPECNLEKQFLKIKEGTSFVFLSFIEAMSFIPASVSWSILFFLMLLMLGLSLMIGTLQGIITPLQDSFSYFRKHPKLLTVVVSVLMFLCGLFFIRPSGLYYIRLLNQYWVVLPIILIITLENMAVGWAYGAKRLLADLRILCNHPVHPIFRWLWCYLSPVVLLVLFAATLLLLTLKTLIYVAWDSSSSKEVLRQYPPWAHILLIVLSLIAVLPIPTYFVYCLTHGIPFKSSSLNQSIISSTSLSLSMHLMPIKEVQKEEILQGDNQISD
ncbi:orphan sodium- and chloride-dependent neurotransmitter transporter NTT5 isoform 3-T4 [Hipposideros larvatus]